MKYILDFVITMNNIIMMRAIIIKNNITAGWPGKTSFDFKKFYEVYLLCLVTVCNIA